MTYAEKLKDPRWQKKRLEVLNRDGFACTECGNKTETLHVHHLYYITNRDPWDYPNWALRTLCSECHEFENEEPSYRKEREEWFEWAMGNNDITPWHSWKHTPTKASSLVCEEWPA
jgi:5-methylcytosine-specific restriction endonuclease McrA